MLDLTTANAILKDEYMPRVREQLEKATVLLDKVGRDSESVVGKQYQINLHTGRNQGIGARNELETLPTAGAQKHQNLTGYVKYLYGAIALSRQTIEASKSNKGAFVSALENEIKGLEEDFIKDVNRQLYRGKNGLSTVTAIVSASTTVNVDTTKHLEVGMSVDIVKNADGTIPYANATIANIVSDTQITLGSAVTLAVGDRLYRPGTWDATANASKEIYGLAQLVSATGTVGNINRATAGNQFFKAKEFFNGGTGRALSINLMEQAWDEASKLGKAPSLIITNPKGRRAYADLLTSQRRYVNTAELDGGWKGLDFNGSALVSDWDAPFLYYMLALDNFKFYEMAPAGFIPVVYNGGDGYLEKVSGKDAYSADFGWYVEFLCDTPQRSAVLGDITFAG
jgi:hypothetical protein